MKSDKRLLMDSYSVMKYKKASQREIEDVKDLYSEETWKPVIEKSVNRALKSVLKSVNEPFRSNPSLTKELNQALEIIEGSVKNDGNINFQRNTEISVVIEWFGKVLAELCTFDYNIWNKVHHTIQHNTDLYLVWLTSLPHEGIEKNIDNIKKIPFYQDPLELVYTWGYYQEKAYRDGFDEYIKSEKEKAINSWELIYNLIRFDNEFTLKPDIEFKSYLLYRYDKEVWLDWIEEFPFLHMKDAALEQVRNIEDVMKLLRHSLLHDNEEMAALLIWKYLELVKRITDNLERTSQNFSMDENEAKHTAGIKEQLNEWNKSELPNHMENLTKILLKENQSLGIQLALSIIRRIKVKKNQRDGIEAKLRESFITELAKQKDVNIQSFLKEPLTIGSLLGALLFSYAKENIESEDYISVLWESYLTLLEQEQFYWDIELHQQEDDFLLLWLLGGILSSFENAILQLREAQNTLNTTTEGWQFNTDSFYKLNRKAVHLLIIGAMAADWLSQVGEQEKAQDLYDFVFEETNARLRQLPDDQLEEFNPLIKQVWARLVMVYPENFNKKAYKAAKNLDHLSHILLALTILLKNIQLEDSDKKMDRELVELMKASYDSKLPLVKMKYGHLPERIKWYESFNWWENDGEIT